MVDSIALLAARAGQPRQPNNVNKIVTLKVRKLQQRLTVRTIVQPV